MTALVYETTCRSPRFEPGAPHLAGQAHAAAEAGFSAITVDVWTLQAELASGRTLGALSGSVELTGMRCAAMAAIRTSDDTTARASAESVLPLISAFRPSVVVTVVEKEVTEAVAEDLRGAAELLTQHGVRPAIEFIPYGPVATLKSAVDLAADVGYGTGVCVDSWHFFHAPDGEAWDALGHLRADDIAYVQFDDAQRPPISDLAIETRTQRAIPGDGILDLQRFAAAVRSTGYDGDVGLEILSGEHHGMSPESFARRLYQAARPYWL